MRVLGIDPSLTATGWCIYDSEQSGSRLCEKWGEIESDSKLPEPVRYRSIQLALRQVILDTNPDYVAIETPIFKASFSEGMYALFVCAQQVLYELRQDVVFLSVTLAKGFARERTTYPDGWKIGKTEMMAFVKTELGLAKLRVKDNNRADAYILACMGARFWAFESGKILQSDLSEYENRSFTHTHTFTRGKKAGKTEKKGIIHRENERYFKWSQVAHGNEREVAKIINESPQGTRLPKVEKSRKPRSVSRHKPAEGIAPASPDGFIDTELLDRWSAK